MAEKTGATTKLSKLEAENKRLKLENQKLQKAMKRSSNNVKSGWFWQKAGSIVFGSFAVALLVAGSLLFWAGNTVVNNQQFVKTVSPVIKNAEVQTAVANYTTQQLYANFDVQNYISDALPPRAQFLAPTLSSQLQSSTESVLVKILASPTFQEKWNTILANAHNKFISAIETHGSDGAFDINELYQGLSSSLTSTPLSFLANRQLPAKIGSIQVISGSWISTTYTVIDNITLWRTLAVLLLFITAAASIYLSRHRRRTVIRLSLAGSTALFATLVSLRLFREFAASSVESMYSEAVRQTVQIIFHPLIVQLFTVLIALLIIALVAWVSGPGRSAQAVRSKIDQLLSGKLHQAIFSKENGFTRWIGKYKRYLKWLVVTIIAISTLFTRLTPQALAIYVVSVLLIIAGLEILAAPTKK